MAPRGAGHGPAALRFSTLAEIASGDTARIDLCRVTEPDSSRGRLVAVKRLHAHLLADRELASMFFDEVWMTASLLHPNVVETVGWGEDDEGPYLAVELVEGVSLARLTKTVFDTGEIFGERMVVYVGSQICRGLAAAHDLRGPDGESLGLVHRDLTPGNVLVGFEGRVKITDFGLAKAKQRITRTVTGLLKGRPQYMAPEQARGDAVDARADLFSLGVVLFELFAGRRPWSGATEFEVLSTTQNDPPADLRELRPKIDRELSNVVMRLLEKAPEDRFASATEVGIRLDEWLAVHGWSDGNDEALARFVRRNAMRQMRWFERAIKGELPVPRRRARAGSMPSLPDNRPSRRERAKRVADDATEVSAAAANAARFDHPDRQETPRALPMLVDVGAPHQHGEEIPTLIQRDRPLTPSAPHAPSVRPQAAHEPAGSGARYPILEEESDQRTTSVRGRSPSSSSSHAPLHPGGLTHEEIEDPETETIPVKGPRQQAVRAAMDAARTSALPPPRPPPRTLHGPSGGTAPHAPPPASSAPSPPSGAPLTSAMGVSSSVPPSGPMHAPSPVPSPPSGGWSVDALRDAADRIAQAAAAADEEAHAAAQAAVLKGAVARRLAELAAHAAHAAHVGASTGDVAGAGRAMEETDRAVASAQRGEVELPGPAPMVDHLAEHQARVSFAPPSHHASLGGGGSPGGPVGGPVPGSSGGPLASTEPAHAAPWTSLDPWMAMVDRLRPLLLGLSPVVAATVAVLAALAVLLLVLVVSG